jgi:hypothetical protein
MNEQEMEKHHYAAPGVHDRFNAADPDSLAHIINQGDNEYPLPGTPRSRAKLVTGAGLTNGQLADGMSHAVGGAFKAGHVQLIIDAGDDCAGHGWRTETTQLTALRLFKAYASQVANGRVPSAATAPEPEPVSVPEVGYVDDALEGNVPTVKAKRQRVPETTEQVRERVQRAKAKAEAALATGDGF